MTERELIDDILYRIEADQHGMIDWIDPVGRARLAAPLEAANKEIAELREAVRVLAEEVSQWHRLCVDSLASDNFGRIRVGKMKNMLQRSEFLSATFDNAIRRSQSNPTARAAIEAAQKEPQ